MNPEFSLNKNSGCHLKLLSFLKHLKAAAPAPGTSVSNPKRLYLLPGWDCKRPSMPSSQHRDEGFALNLTLLLSTGVLIWGVSLLQVLQHKEIIIRRSKVKYPRSCSQDWTTNKSHMSRRHDFTFSSFSASVAS